MVFSMCLCIYHILKHQFFLSCLNPIKILYNFINKVEKFTISREYSVFSKLSLVENLEKVLTLPGDEELKWYMKTSLDKCKIIHSDKCDSTHKNIQLWAFVRYSNAEKQSWSIFELFS